MRLIFFLPSGVTDKTTSTLFPQLLQHCDLLLLPARAETSVLDFTFSAILFPPFHIYNSSLDVPCALFVRRITVLLTIFFLLDGKSRAGTDDTTEENHKNSLL